MDGSKLFTDVRFVLAQCNNSEEIKGLLLDSGAKHINYLSDIVTHVIADTNCPEAEEAVDLYDKPVVTSLWVHLCLKSRVILPPEAFSPIRRIFSNVTATFSRDLTSKDIEILAATITFYGGKISKDLLTSTHLIAISAKPSDLSENQTSLSHNFKLVAPDWVLDSIKQKNCCDEVHYEPGLLKDPPPPTPPPVATPSPVAPAQQQQPATVKLSQQTEFQAKDRDVDDSIYRPESHNILNDQANRRNELQSQIRPPNLSQPLHQRPVGSYMQQQQFQKQTLMQTQIQATPSSQLPRPRMGSNMNSRLPVQQKFRPTLQQDNNMSMNPRQQVQMNQTMPRPSGPEQRKVGPDYSNSFRKMSPYQNGPDVQPMSQVPPPGQPYQPVQHVHMQQPHQNNMIGQHPPTRVPHPNMYQQSRGPYANNQMPARMAMNQPQMMNQPIHQMNRFQDPNSQIPQRHYPVYAQQPQQVGTSFHQSGTVHSQPTYYSQGPVGHMPMRPQQVPVNRAMGQSEQNFQEGYTQHHSVHQEAQSIQQSQPPIQYQTPYQNQPPSMPIQQHSQQLQPPPMQNQQFQQSHPPPMVMQPRQQLVQQSGPSSAPIAVRGLPPIQTRLEVRPPSVRQPVASQISAPQQARTPRTPPVQPQPQPHPSIFDNKQETNLAQLRAKVPVIIEDIKYFDHDLSEKVPEDMPLIGCKFKMIEHTKVRPQDKMLWVEAIEEAGGTFPENDSELTHLICETQLTDYFRDSLRKSIRCITVYWINDVLAQNRLKHPWKALHFPKWFNEEDKPLKNQIISITNIKGRERREVVEMIIRSGGIYTDSFCHKNTLLICGAPGGEKYERAIVWRIPITNCQILVDFFLGGIKDFSELLTMSKYQNFRRSDLLSVDSYSKVRNLMSPWTRPIPVPGSQDKKIGETPKSSVSPEKEAHNTQQSEDSGIANSGSSNGDGDGAGRAESLLSTEKNPNSNPNIDLPTEEGERAHVDKIDKIDYEHRNQNTIVQGIPTGETPISSVSISIVNTVSNPTICATEFSENTEGPKQPDDDETEKVDEDNFVDCKESQSTEPVCSQAGSEKLIDHSSTSNTSGKPLRTSNEPVRLLFTRIEKKLVAELQSYATELKLGMATCPNDCTHLVVNGISRTPKFICALNHARYILNYQWLIESHKAQHVLDEKAFILQDHEGEEKFSFSLIHSLLKRRKRAGKPLFANYIFFVTPTIVSKVLNLKEIIESAGGVVVSRKLPTKTQLNQIKSTGKRFIVVTNQQDLHLVSSIEPLGVDIVGSEFIMSGILRQDIDFEAHRIKIRPTPADIATRKAEQLVKLSSATKKIRIG